MKSYKVYKVSYFGSTYIAEELESALSEIYEMQVDEEVTIKCIEMTQQELDVLPEFQGF